MTTSLLPPNTKRINPLGRVEGDLDLNTKVDDGVVTDAWTEASTFCRFEIILKGKDRRPD